MTDRLTAMEIQKQEFRRQWRGLDAEEVQMFLQSVAAEVERLNLHNAELREEAGGLRRELEELRSRERTLQETLVTAQKMADELTERSRERAGLIVKEARMKSERALQEHQDQLARLEGEISRAKLDRDMFEKRLRATIDEHLDLLERRQEGRSGLDNVHPLRRFGSDAG